MNVFDYPDAPIDTIICHPKHEKALRTLGRNLLIVTDSCEGDHIYERFGPGRNDWMQSDVRDYDEGTGSPYLCNRASVSNLEEQARIRQRGGVFYNGA